MNGMKQIERFIEKFKYHIRTIKIVSAAKTASQGAMGYLIFKIVNAPHKASVLTFSFRQFK